MAKSQLYVRWQKRKGQVRRSLPKAFGNRGSSTFYAHVKKTESMFQAQQRVPFSKGSVEYNLDRLNYHIKRLKPHHVILGMMFKPAIQQAIERDPDSIDPKLAVDILWDRYARQDETLAAFQFDVIHMEHSGYHDKWLYFRGRECFIVFRRDREVRISQRYNNVHFLKSLPIKKVEWAGEPVILTPMECNEFTSSS